MDTNPNVDQLAALRPMPNRPSTETLFDAGTVAIGRHAEGNDAVLELYSPDGAVATAIAGRPGSGVGALLGTLWDTELATGLVESWVVDLDGTHTASRPLARGADTVARAVELVTEARELVLARVRDGLIRPAYQGYRPTADQPLVTLTLVGLSYLVEKDERIQGELETISRFARRGGLSLRSVDHPGERVPGVLGRFFGKGSLIELLAGRPGNDPQPVLPGTGLLTPPFGEPVLFRAWPQMPGA